jgi:hypothetical protein
MAVPGMGHAFDPIGHRGICEGIDLLAGPAAAPIQRSQFSDHENG